MEDVNFCSTTITTIMYSIAFIAKTTTFYGHGNFETNIYVFAQVFNIIEKGHGKSPTNSKHYFE